MPELVATLNAVYKKEERSQRFLAAIQGIDLDKHNQNNDGATTLQQIHARVEAKLSGDTTKAKAIEYGFTSDIGLGYESYGVD